MDTIGERIKRVRKINELNQVEFSKIIGVSQGTLSEIEQDKYYPSTETIMAIYTNFRTDIHWILFGRESSQEKITFYDTLKNDEVKLLNTYRNLKQQDQEEIIDYIYFKQKRS
ncbi:MAG: helix-turn-helix domain-containing protein [Bacillota bacterium]